MQKNCQATEQNDDTAHPDKVKAGPGSPDRRTVGQGGRTAVKDPPAAGEKPAADSSRLAGRLRQGERTAAEEFVDRYYERIYLFMRAVGHDRQISEDLTQETFLRAWYHIGQLRDGKALNGWLFRIAGNVSRLHRRRHKDKGTAPLDGVEPPAGGTEGSQWAGQREQVDHVRAAVARLPWKLRQAIVLHYMEQLTIAEAAEAAGIRQGTLKSRLNRGLEALRQEVPGE
jgi:RNA polymerase sigma-70 factor (ECF subfamily)